MIIADRQAPDFIPVLCFEQPSHHAQWHLSPPDLCLFPQSKKSNLEETKGEEKRKKEKKEQQQQQQLGLLQRAKNLVSASALLTGKKLCVRKIFARMVYNVSLQGSILSRQCK